MKTGFYSFFLLSVLALFGNNLRAQYVTIPDAKFADWLNNEYPACMSGNQLDTTCTAIRNAIWVTVTFKSISNLDGIQYFTALKWLDCSNNTLTGLPVLPGSVDTLMCMGNNITSLPALPSLNILNCSNNLIEHLPALPVTLTDLMCADNLLADLPDLNDGLAVLLCHNNQIKTLPDLPASLQSLDCSANTLDSLPVFPGGLRELVCFNCGLKNMPLLPGGLSRLTCFNNKLYHLPALPGSLTELHCANNYLGSLPELPASLRKLYCNDNNIGCFPVFPETLKNLSIAGNPYTCLPNYVAVMDANTMNVPLCLDGDGINNPNGCRGIHGIIGSLYSDKNNDCEQDSTENTMQNIWLSLYDSTGKLLNHYVASNHFYFTRLSGRYTVTADTAGKPYTATCYTDSTIEVSPDHGLKTVDFAFGCKEGFDIGVHSIVPEGWVFPGQPHELNITAGDMAAIYGLHCPTASSGKLTVEVSGPVRYQTHSNGSMVPSSVTGNTFTYNIPDFATLDINKAFGLLFKTDTSANAGDSICVHVTVTPVSGDRNAANNVMHLCYRVVNSHDPNMKEVYPTQVLPSYTDWLTYTVHFQNTGVAPAFTIRLADTLDAGLDAETFQLMDYSHPVSTSLSGSKLAFYFKDIMLPDSMSNEKGSHGFVQYRIKPKASQLDNRVVRNTAYIYFDYNAAVVTNTAETWFKSDPNASVDAIQQVKVTVYPNPGSGKFYILLPAAVSADKLQYEVTTIQGLRILSGTLSENKLVDLGAYANGLYLLKLTGNGMNAVSRLIKE